MKVFIFSLGGFALITLFQNCTNRFEALNTGSRRIASNQQPIFFDEEETSFVPAGYEMIFNDEFEGTGDLDTSSNNRLWRHETIDDSFHSVGNFGQDETGNLVNNGTPIGKRWSAWYNGPKNQVISRENGYLSMGGVLTNTPDPTRAPYTQNGQPVRFNEGRMYTGWIDTSSRVQDPESGFRVDPAQPMQVFRYGYFEVKVNFSQMRTPGFRISAWLMPSSIDDAGLNTALSNAYNGNANDGAEIDLFEYEATQSFPGQPVVVAIHGGSTEAGFNSIVSAQELEIDMTTGDHVFGLLWEADRIVWYLDGIEIARVTDRNKIPDVYSYFIFSREMNSGVKTAEQSNDASDAITQGVKVPPDFGLFAENIYFFRDRINDDKALIDYLRVYQAP